MLELFPFICIPQPRSCTCIPESKILSADVLSCSNHACLRHRNTLTKVFEGFLPLFLNNFYPNRDSLTRLPHTCQQTSQEIYCDRMYTRGGSCPNSGPLNANKFLKRPMVMGTFGVDRRVLSDLGDSQAVGNNWLARSRGNSGSPRGKFCPLLPRF